MNVSQILNLMERAQLPSAFNTLVLLSLCYRIAVGVGHLHRHGVIVGDFNQLNAELRVQANRSTTSAPATRRSATSATFPSTP